MTRTAIANGDTGLATRTSLNALFCNSVTTDPGTANDTTQGFAVGSPWYNSATEMLWICEDATTSAAVWRKQRASGFPGFISGHWHDLFTDYLQATGGGAPSTAVTLYPFEVQEKMTIAALGVAVTTLNAGNAMVGIYAHNVSTGVPTGTPLASVTSLSTAATGSVSANLGANVDLHPGRTYWAGGQTDNTTARLSSVAATVAAMAGRIGSATLSKIASATGAALRLEVTNTFASGFPDLTSATFAESNSNTAMVPRVYAKVA